MVATQEVGLLMRHASLPDIGSRFYHNGLDRLYEWAQAIRPGASEDYIRVSDHALHQFLDPEIVANPESPRGEQKTVSLSSIEQTLASMPQYSCTEAPRPYVEQITCPATLVRAHEVRHPNRKYFGT